MQSFDDILAKPTLFRDRNVLSPHYIPETLPHREAEIEKIMKAVSPALVGQRPRNLLIYGKTGTGKTSCVKYVMEKLSAHPSESKARVCYTNCRVYNSRYRVIQKIINEFVPKYDKAGYGLAFLYEKMLDWIEEDGKTLLIVLDEVDMVKDLDDLTYTLTRSNDDLEKGAVSIIGISNKLSFKERLDPRSRSTLFETEMVFSPYSSYQLKEILKQRIRLGFNEGVMDEGAINLAAAIAAQDNGDARYALKLLLKAGEIAEEEGSKVLLDKYVEQARKTVDQDISFEAITTLPKHQQLVLRAIAGLQLEGGQYGRLGNGTNGDESGGAMLSGEVYEKYSQISRSFGTEARSARWYREYLSDLEMLGLITMTESGKGQRGHTRFIKLAYPPDKIKKIIESSLYGE